MVENHPNSHEFGYQKMLHGVVGGSEAGFKNWGLSEAEEPILVEWHDRAGSVQ